MRLIKRISYTVPAFSSDSKMGNNGKANTMQQVQFNDMGRMGAVWQVLLGLVVIAGGASVMVVTLGWAATIGIFLLVFGMIVVNGTKFPKKNKGGKKKR